MARPTETRAWMLKRKPTGWPTITGPEPTWTFETHALPALKPDEVLVKVVCLSNDPAQRAFIASTVTKERHYVEPVAEGAVMRSKTLSVVVEVGSAVAAEGQLAVGTQVLCPAGWAEHAVLAASACVPVERVEGVDPVHMLGTLGSTGFSAWIGLVQIAAATADDVVVISGAAGAVGCTAVQLAKHVLGCKRVIGIAGGADKCRWVESLGADVCVDYKAADFEQQLARATPDLVDVFFDNVGGPVLDAAMHRVKPFGRITACGAISGYNAQDTPLQLRHYTDLITNRITLRGFITSDYMHKYAEMTEIYVKAMREGKLRADESVQTVVDAKLEDVPGIWLGLFRGANTGKLITRLVT